MLISLTQATKKAEILEFVMKKNISIPSPVPTRPVLLERIKLVQVESISSEGMAMEYYGYHHTIVCVMLLNLLGAS